MKYIATAFFLPYLHTSRNYLIFSHKTKKILKKPSNKIQTWIAFKMLLTANHFKEEIIKVTWIRFHFTELQNIFTKRNLKKHVV